MQCYALINPGFEQEEINSKDTDFDQKKFKLFFNNYKYTKG